FSLGDWRVREMAERGNVREKAAAALFEKAEDVLAAIVLGNALANAGLVLAGLWAVWMWKWPFWPTLLGIFFLILFACEVFPKTLAVRSPESWSVRVAGFMRWWCDSTHAIRHVTQRAERGILRLIIPSSIQPRTALNDE